MRTRVRRTVLAVVATVLSLGGPAAGSLHAAPDPLAAQPAPPPVQWTRPPAAAQAGLSKKLSTSKRTGSPSHLSSNVQQLAAPATPQEFAALAANKGVQVQSASVVVEVQAQPGQVAAASAALTSVGARVRSTYRDWLDAAVPPTALHALDGVGAIKWVDVPPKLQPMAVNEALGLINATAWQAANVTGTGVKVAIIDTEFSGYPALLGNALPATVDTSCSPYDPNQGGPHGAAVAEIVHSVAPGAQLYLALVTTTVEIGNATNCLLSKGVTVVNMSLSGGYMGPGNGTGLIQSIVDTAVAGGIFWANSAGNYANAHWGGPWVADPANPTLLDFAPGNPTEGIILGSGELLDAQLRWNDPWGGSCNDYDFFLLDASLNIVSSSENAQTCSQNPFERIAYTPSTTGVFYFAVTNFAANGNAKFDLLVQSGLPDGALQFVVAAGSLVSPADSANAGMTAVGAVAWDTPTTIESFSSQGPTTDGRIKPDITGPDHVSTNSFGPLGFRGTSAASPHVAGAAALVKQSNPAFTPAQIKAFLTGRAIDLGSAGPDNVFGSGRLFLGSPPGAASLITTLPTPVRLADTRSSSGAIASGNSRCFTVVNVGGIPGDAGAVVLNVTAANQTTNGWLTVYPNGQSVPATSTLNFGQSEYAIANGTVMRVGTGGQVCVNVGTVDSTPGSSQVILDATAYLPAASLSLMSMLPAPVRLADTRPTTGAIQTGGSRCFPIAGIGGIPADAAAVVLNVTAANYGAIGWLTAYPNGQPVPATSTVNFTPSQWAMANNAIMRIGAGGQVCINVGTVNSVPGSAQVILDATGYLTAAGLQQMPMLTSPQRVVDTRPTSGAIQTGNSRCFTLAGLNGIPPTATGLVLNLTAVEYAAQGWLTAYPAGVTVPPTSTQNFDPSEFAIANGAIVGLNSSGQMCVSVGTINSVPGSSQAIIDVVGYLLN